jgi:tetratricopeptide (TPR) repeat protein
MITTVYMDYPVPGKHRNGDAASLPMNDAFEAFERHKFARAADLFENYFETPGKENTSNLYAGISLLQTKKAKNYPRAIVCFERVLSSPNPRNEAAEWFLAIGRYELGQKDQARILFSKIADNPRHFRQAQAREILAEYY